MSDEPSVLSVLETIRAEMRRRDRLVDDQLAKIHDLVNSQLTEAVNRFRDALKTIEELKALLFNQGTAVPSGLDLTKARGPAPPPPAPDTPSPDELLFQHIGELMEAAKVMSLKLIEQSEKISALIIEKRARRDTDQRVERRRVFP
jgi:hypothetical protein